ncbi:hypothetical protein K3N28_16870 [Glycomyces sp. TRM65418]|uniref:hypothetical protein n=1 Tax=Glycomyces sp. TRM65418 TaxID=2867006 RepID=UPI001CE6649E|nr:hypothetical protein [Glycomyces sp. TRM65418]MCC3764732.1 hypothetical protein [Glycomyces sp. TRM65418]QZD54389.1 hypothetical protein K3N28_16785 [Glycomyces sp. TRM65418]
MRCKGSDQGGRWPVGIWFALVGMSAGTVGSFSLIGWTFAQGLYDGESGAEPLEFDPGTVVIEAEEPPVDEPEDEGLAGGDDGLDGLTEPGREPDTAASPAEPRTGRVEETAEAPEEVPEAPVEESREERHEAEATEPPHLVPVDEDEDDGDCGHDEAEHGPDGRHGDGSTDESDGGRGDEPTEDPDGAPAGGHVRHEDPYLSRLFGEIETEIDIDLDLDLLD